MRHGGVPDAALSMSVSASTVPCGASGTPAARTRAPFSSIRVSRAVIGLGVRRTTATPPGCCPACSSRASDASSLALPAFTIAAVTGTAVEIAGLGSAVLSSVQQLGGAVGLAVLVTLATRRGGGLVDSLGPRPSALGTRRAATEGFPYAPTVAATILAVAVLVATVPGRAGTDNRVPRAG